MAAKFSRVEVGCGPMTAPSLQPKTVPELVHGSEESLEWDGDLTATMARSRYRVAARRINRPSDDQPLSRELKGFAYFSARPLTELLPVDHVTTGTRYLPPAHRRYFGLFNPAPTVPAAPAAYQPVHHVHGPTVVRLSLGSSLVRKP